MCEQNVEVHSNVIEELCEFHEFDITTTEFIDALLQDQ